MPLVQSSEWVPPPTTPEFNMTGPPPGASLHASLLWYAIQQALLSSFQAITDLCTIPPLLAAYVTARLQAYKPALVIGATGPGNCLWQVNKLTKPFAGVLGTADGTQPLKELLTECREGAAGRAGLCHDKWMDEECDPLYLPCIPTHMR